MVVVYLFFLTVFPHRNDLHAFIVYSECVFLNLMVMRSNNIIIGVIYRQCGATKEQFNAICETVLSTIKAERTDCYLNYLKGDYIINLLILIKYFMI